jgi:hypothetical protein
MIKKSFSVHSVNILIFWKSLAHILIAIMTSFDNREYISPDLSWSHISGSLSGTELRPEFSFKSFKIYFLGIFLYNSFSLDIFSLSLLRALNLISKDIIFAALFGALAFIL